MNKKIIKSKKKIQKNQVIRIEYQIYKQNKKFWDTTI